MLRPSELARMRRDFARTLPDVCTIEGVVSTRQMVDGHPLASTDDTPQAITQADGQTTLRCRVLQDIYTPLQDNDAEKLTTATTHNILLPYNALVQPGQHLVVGSKRYRVMDTDAGSSEAVDMIAMCQEIT